MKPSLRCRSTVSGTAWGLSEPPGGPRVPRASSGPSGSPGPPRGPSGSPVGLRVPWGPSGAFGALGAPRGPSGSPGGLRGPSGAPEAPRGLGINQVYSVILFSVCHRTVSASSQIGGRIRERSYRSGQVSHTLSPNRFGLCFVVPVTKAFIYPVRGPS